MVYDGQWHGAPPEAPFATVDGAFELTGFPYGEREGQFSSVFFVKQGQVALHLSVRAPEESQAAPPQLGVLDLQALDAGKGSITGALVRLDVKGRSVESYPDAEVSFDGPGGKVAVRAGGPEGFHVTLAPGRYEVRVDGERATTPEVVVVAGQGAPLILQAPGPLTKAK